MVWSIPAAKTIIARMAAVAETALLTLRPDATAKAVSRAVRSQRGVFAHVFGAVAPEIREAHDHQAWWARQYMPDSADDEAMILRHANIWGTEQRGAIKAVGAVLIQGTAGVPIASGIALSSSTGETYVTTAGGTIGVTGTLTVSAEAVTAGADGNLEAGVKLSTVSAEPDITTVTASTAFSGGADEQTPEEIKADYLQRIREPPHGGSSADYKVWVGDVADVYAVRVVEDWIGRGSVGIVVVLRDEDGSPRIPTEEELATIADYLGAVASQTGVRPVTARVIVVAGELVEVPVTVRLRLDTALIRVAVQEAYERFIATIGDEDDEENEQPIGATIELSRLSEALSAADGEYAHDIILPAASYTLGTKECPVAATVNFVA